MDDLFETKDFFFQHFDQQSFVWLFILFKQSFKLVQILLSAEEFGTQFSKECFKVVAMLVIFHFFQSFKPFLGPKLRFFPIVFVEEARADGIQVCLWELSVCNLVPEAVANSRQRRMTHTFYFFGLIHFTVSILSLFFNCVEQLLFIYNLMNKKLAHNSIPLTFV